MRARMLEVEAYLQSVRRRKIVDETVQQLLEALVAKETTKIR